MARILADLCSAVASPRVSDLYGTARHDVHPLAGLTPLLADEPCASLWPAPAAIVESRFTLAVALMLGHGSVRTTRASSRGRPSTSWAGQGCRNR